MGNVLSTQYRMGREIGSGAMGIVCEAWRTLPDGTEQRIAIKRLAADASTNPLAHEYFRREAEVLLSLSHPNILRAFECARDAQGNDYLVMELVDGASLSEILPFVRSPELIRVILYGVLAALHYLHEHGHLHRDIKPENILVSRRGSVLLADFGMVTMPGAKVTAAGFKGTPAYASPEALAGERVTPSDEVYSVAALAYHLLTGKAPFGDDITDNIRERMNAWKLAPLPADTPADLRRVIEGGLVRSQRRAFVTAKEMMQVLLHAGERADARALGRVVRDALDGLAHRDGPEPHLEPRSLSQQGTLPPDVAVEPEIPLDLGERAPGGVAGEDHDKARPSVRPWPWAGRPLWKVRLGVALACGLAALMALVLVSLRQPVPGDSADAGAHDSAVRDVGASESESGQCVAGPAARIAERIPWTMGALAAGEGVEPAARGAAHRGKPGRKPAGEPRVRARVSPQAAEPATKGRVNTHTMHDRGDVPGTWKRSEVVWRLQAR